MARAATTVDNQPGDHPEDPGGAGVAHGQHDVGADGDELAVGEVGEADDAEDHGDPERQERVGRAKRETVKKLLQDAVHLG